MISREQGSVYLQLTLALSLFACPEGAASGGPGDADAALPTLPTIDAGLPGDDRLPDASSANPDPIPDTGDGGALANLVARALCGVNTASREVVTIAFPSGQVLRRFQYDRVLNTVYAVDAVHDEVYVSTPDAQGLQVFSATASNFALPLRTLTTTAYPEEFSRGVLAAAVDTSNDTVIVAMGSTGGRYVETYARTTDGQTQPSRRFELPSDLLSGATELAVDSSGERLLITDSSKVYAFSLTASGTAVPLETVDQTCRGVAVSPVRGEVHLACPSVTDAWEIRTWPLGVSFAEAPLRTLTAPFELGPLLADELHAEIYVRSTNLPVFDMDAVGTSDPLATSDLVGRNESPLQFMGLLPARNELVLQGGLRGSVEVYARPLAPGAFPSRILEGQLDSAELLGVDAMAGELYLRHAAGSVNVYSSDASGGITLPLRRLRGIGGGGRVALAQGSRELFAAGPSPAVEASPPGVFDGTGQGQVSPIRSLPPGPRAVTSRPAAWRAARHYEQHHRRHRAKICRLRHRLWGWSGAPA
jgi:hypothetical protein